MSEEAPPPGTTVGRSPGNSARARITIVDVAARAGVSIGTVSHVLSGPRYVAPATRARVERAVADLGYRRNQIASSLALRRTFTLGMIVPDVANPFFGELVRAVEVTARAAGYCVIFGNSDNDPSQELRYVTEFAERRVDGLLIVSAAGRVQAVGQIPVGCPIVAVDRLPEGFEEDAVIVDNQLGMELVVDHLVSLGHREIGFIGGAPQLSTQQGGRAGFETSLNARIGPPAWISEGAFSLDSGRAQATALFSGARRLTALVAEDDLLALGVLGAARDAHVRVPGDLSVVGFDDIAYAALADPALTTVRQPVAEMGAEAARLLLRRVGGDSGARQVLVLPPSIVVRKSTARPPTRRDSSGQWGGRDVVEGAAE
jgi:LacI family transcriptional regulator